MKRKALSKKTRFEVFKRDSFTCQYCGGKAPDVLLAVDHVEPVASGGSNALLNLVTSCVSCNAGKGKTRLDDSSALEKQRRQLEELQERREQLELMMEWQKSLHNLDDFATDKLADYWADLVPGWSLNESGRKDLRRLLRKYKADEVMLGMRVAAESYVELSGDPPVASRDSVGLAWSKVPGVCSVRRAEKDRPYLQDLLYVRGILRNRMSIGDPRACLRLLERAHVAGASIEDLKELALDGSSWWRVEDALLDWIAELEAVPETDG